MFTLVVPYKTQLLVGQFDVKSGTFKYLSHVFNITRGMHTL